MATKTTIGGRLDCTANYSNIDLFYGPYETLDLAKAAVASRLSDPTYEDWKQIIGLTVSVFDHVDDDPTKSRTGSTEYIVAATEFDASGNPTSFGLVEKTKRADKTITGAIKQTGEEYTIIGNKLDLSPIDTRLDNLEGRIQINAVNPSETATATLEKITLGNTIYEVSGGSGGGSYYEGNGITIDTDKKIHSKVWNVLNTDSRSVTPAAGDTSTTVLNIPYYFNIVPSADKITVTELTVAPSVETDTTQNKKFASWTKEFTGAVAPTTGDAGQAGLLTAADKAKLPDVPSSEGTYVLVARRDASGNITYNWDLGSTNANAANVVFAENEN